MLFLAQSGNGEYNGTNSDTYTVHKEKVLQPEEQTDPLDFSCGGGSSSDLIQQHNGTGYDAAAASAKSVAHPYAFSRPLHADYATERSFYYRDSLGIYKFQFQFRSNLSSLFKLQVGYNGSQTVSYNGYGSNGTDTTYCSGFGNTGTTGAGYPPSPTATSLGGCTATSFQYGGSTSGGVGGSPGSAAASTSPMLMGCYAPRASTGPTASLMLGLSAQEKSSDS